MQAFGDTMATNDAVPETLEHCGCDLVWNGQQLGPTRKMVYHGQNVAIATGGFGEWTTKVHPHHIKRLEIEVSIVTLKQAMTFGLRRLAGLTDLTPSHKVLAISGHAVPEVVALKEAERLITTRVPSRR